MAPFGAVVLFVVALFILITILKTLYTVRTAQAGVVERFGKFNRIVRPGLHLLIPFAERVFFVNLQVQQASFVVETKTRDNVFVQIPVSVQYQVQRMLLAKGEHTLPSFPTIDYRSVTACGLPSSVIVRVSVRLPLALRMAIVFVRRARRHRADCADSSQRRVVGQNADGSGSETDGRDVAGIVFSFLKILMRMVPNDHDGRRFAIPIVAIMDHHDGRRLNIAVMLANDNGRLDITVMLTYNDDRRALDVTVVPSEVVMTTIIVTLDTLRRHHALSLHIAVAVTSLRVTRGIVAISTPSPIVGIRGDSGQKHRRGGQDSKCCRQTSGSKIFHLGSLPFLSRLGFRPARPTSIVYEREMKVR